MTPIGLTYHFLTLIIVTGISMLAIFKGSDSTQFFLGWVGGNIAMVIMIYADQKWRKR